MQKLTKVQITILIVLFCTAVILGILAFSPLERESEEEIARPMLTPQTVEFKLAEPTPSPVPIPLPTITPEPITAIEPSENGSNPILQNQSALFALDIKGEKVDIAYGVEKDTLDETPGWLETSAYPGEEGVCVIYGHRNRNHLKALNSCLKCTMESNSCRYSNSLLSNPKKFSITALSRQFPFRLMLC